MPPSRRPPRLGRPRQGARRGPRGDHRSDGHPLRDLLRRRPRRRRRHARPAVGDRGAQRAHRRGGAVAASPHGRRRDLGHHVAAVAAAGRPLRPPPHRPVDGRAGVDRPRRGHRRRGDDARRRGARQDGDALGPRPRADAARAPRRRPPARGRPGRDRRRHADGPAAAPRRGRRARERARPRLVAGQPLGRRGRLPAVERVGRARPRDGAAPRPAALGGGAPDSRTSASR